MTVKSLFILFFLLNIGTAQATVTEVEKHLLKVVQSQVIKNCESCQAELRLLNKDIVDDIAIPDNVYADHWKGQTNLILQIGKESRIVTADIRWIDKVVIAKKNIKQGHLMQKNDVRVVDKDVTYLKIPYLQKAQQVVGLVGQRVFSRGQVIDESKLKKPLVIRYGQPIKLQIKEKTLSIFISGKARGSGAVGDRIPVYIPRTHKKVFAKIIDESTARIE